MPTTDKKGITDVLLGVLALIEDAEPSALSESTVTKVKLYAGLIGGGIDNALTQANLGNTVPVIVDAAATILEKVDEVWDAFAAQNAAKKVTATAPAPASAPVSQQLA